MSIEGKRVLYISYNGMLDPLGQSQVIPYLKQLSRRGVQFTLLSFERAASLDSDGVVKCKQLHDQLAEHGIEWDWLRYHQKPSLPATAYDVIQGLVYGKRLVRLKKIEMVHARSHIPAMIAVRLKRQFGIKMIFDVRGLLADEYVDAQHWRKGSTPYRLTKRIERQALANADGIVTLTEKIWPIIQTWDGLSGRDPFHEVIPCCADLELFKFDSDQRAQRRTELALQNQFVIVYSGSIDGWYLTDKMADFFAAWLERDPTAHFLWLVPGKHKRIRELMQQRKIAPEQYTVIAASPREVPSYLSAADAGVAFIKPCFSKLASSPTKFAEYLACGLPLVINAGIGDSDDLITKERAGVLLSDFGKEEYAKTVTAINEFRQPSIRSRMRAVAERLFDVATVGATRYARLYEKVLGAN